MDAFNLAIGWTCLILGAIAICVGIYTALQYRNQQIPQLPEPQVGDQGAINDIVKSSTEFAKALKDLDLSGKLLTVGVLLIAIAAIVAGLDAVAEAIESIAK